MSLKVLVIAPHPDDEVIGCGGTICLHLQRNDRVSTVFLTSGELALKHLPKEDAWRIREREAADAAAVLGIGSFDFLRLPDWYVGQHPEKSAEALTPILTREAPDILYLPHTAEWHPDHAAAMAITRLAVASADIPPPFLATYEAWTPLAEYNHVEDISGFMERKLQAIQCYPSQLTGFRYDRAIRGLNEYRGALAAKCDYAEVFQCFEGSQ